MRNEPQMELRDNVAIMGADIFRKTTVSLKWLIIGEHRPPQIEIRHRV